METYPLAEKDYEILQEELVKSSRRVMEKAAQLIWESLADEIRISIWTFLYSRCTKFQVNWKDMSPGVRGSIAKTILIPDYWQQYWEYEKEKKLTELEKQENCITTPPSLGIFITNCSSIFDLSFKEDDSKIVLNYILKDLLPLLNEQDFHALNMKILEHSAELGAQK